MSGSKMAPTYCWTFWSLGLYAKGIETRVPTQITCQIFKEHPRALEASGRARSIAASRTHTPQINAHKPTTLAASRPGLRGARSIAPIRGLSTHCHPVQTTGREAAGALAQGLAGGAWGRLPSPFGSTPESAPIHAAMPARNPNPVRTLDRA